ncbi:unnamed protein product [Boreogadus saida]
MAEGRDFATLLSENERAPAEKGNVLPELSCQLLPGCCQAAAKLRPPELLVCWSTKSQLCSDWRRVGKGEVIFKCAPFLRKNAHARANTAVTLAQVTFVELECSCPKVCPSAHGQRVELTMCQTSGVPEV